MPLGTTYDGVGTNFAIFSAAAERRHRDYERLMAGDDIVLGGSDDLRTVLEPTARRQSRLRN